ncbi:MAG: type II secretion system protein [Planctomycetota bacterium]|nr:MAG: type II secretion system protein [Planctomycetota bacterium]
MGHGARRARRGFTLVELLLVITIIAILAAVATPLVAQHMDNAQQAAAESNYNAAVKAVQVYFTENGVYPPSLDPSLFMHDDLPVMPAGYSLTYDPATGEVTLISPP